LVQSDISAVSDTSSANPTADKSGPTIKDVISQKSIYQVDEAHCHIVPDDAEKISNIVLETCNSGSIDWLITTGGTGFGIRDVTPEVRVLFIR
jgi:gephyrin